MPTWIVTLIGRLTLEVEAARNEAQTLATQLRSIPDAFPNADTNAVNASPHVSTYDNMPENIR